MDVEIVAIVGGEGWEGELIEHEKESGSED